MPETNQVQGSAEPAGPSLVTSQEPPQGAAAAQLAAAAKPRHAVPQSVTEAALPAPLAASQTLPVGRSAFVPPDLPEPAALDAPAVEPGTAPLAGNNAPLLAVAAGPRNRDDGWADMLGLKNLPIPGLGSVQAAHAAALDMPVPQAPAQSASPFAPAEQNAPLTMPGAPDIPANIPRRTGR